jgi:L-seryl-tRNA(Ser) seleniumtransferase
MISASPDTLEDRGRRVIAAVDSPFTTVVSSLAAVGGGSTPGETLPSCAVAVRVPGLAPQEVARRLRQRPLPIIPHIANDRVVLDLRTVHPEDDNDVAAALREVTAAVS